MKPKTTPKTPKNFNSDTFWRHYVATDATDADMLEDEKKSGNASRIFIFLLLLHAFFIGAVVLYNLVAERPKPAFADSTTPLKKPGDTGKGVPVPVAQGKTVEYVVATGDSLKTIADKTGATQDEIVQMNGLDRGNSISVGKKLHVPDREPPQARSVATPQVPQPGPAPQEVVVAVQKTTRPGVMETFHAVEPRGSDTKAEHPAKMAIQDSPPEKIEAVAQVRPKVEDKLPEEPKPAKRNVEDSPPVAKPAEAKPAPGRVAEPKPIAKVAEIKKTPAPEPVVAKPAAAKPAEAKPVAAKPAEAKPAAAKPAAAKPGNEIAHTVKAGETPYAIARKYGITPDQLMRHNGVKDASKLKIGTVLKVPPK
ncbi:MAG TPA: LysM peptidoglycan-binding domain-containing protein [Candidatus Saccharimonadia bacterium]|nr:LysM peptidoglycan-binding domain-containing protein [Candidatus Saccharimonadia bacterium]